ncbi:NUDIX domain-containing protein [Dactylosporangium sp. NPDC049140]|uniref:NUDIX domain-containing protein n=1 Tax=Dactylosporangium sp. NPDC049140 TaxID=3155647 RepID=UPI0033DF68E7
MPFEPFRAAVAVHGILRDGERTLLMRRADTTHRDGQFGLPAGHLDGGEDAVTGLRRELREELDIHVDPGSCRLRLVLHTAPERISDFEYLHLFFDVARWDGAPRIAEPRKCTELRWADPRATPDLVDYVGAALAAIGRGETLAVHGWPPGTTSEPGRSTRRGACG